MKLWHEWTVLGFWNTVSVKLMHIVASHLKYLKLKLRTASAGEENRGLEQILSDFLYSAAATEIIIKWSELLWLPGWFVCLFVCSGRGLFCFFLTYKFNGKSGTCLATKSNEDSRNASWNWEMYLAIVAQPLLSCLSGVPDSVQAP